MLWVLKRAVSMTQNKCLNYWIIKYSQFYAKNFAYVREFSYLSALTVMIISPYCFSAAVFTIVSMLVIAIATVCLVQLHTRLFDKFLPDTSKIESWSDEEVDEHLALQTVRDFKFR